MFATTKGIRRILSPLLIISYLCGMRIIEFPAEYPRQLLSILYNLLLWLVYIFFLIDTVILYVPDTYNIEITICIWLRIFSTLLIILLGLYHDKKFRNCIKKLAIVDDTIEKLGATTDYEKQRIRLILVLVGWFVITIFAICFEYVWWSNLYNKMTRAIIMLFIIYYCSYIDIINDLTFASVIEYLGLKFDQVNGYLYEVTDDQFTNNECKVKWAWENSILRNSQRHKFSIASNNKDIWIAIHLHLELRKIFCEVNSIFRIQMTLKMASYFTFIAQILQVVFDILFETNVGYKTLLCVAVLIFWLCFYLFWLFLINIVCQKVSDKANVTGDIIKKISYSIHPKNVEIRENIMQFLLQTTRAPLKFHGFGFIFGFKFLHKFAESILTFLVILIQSKNYYSFLKNF